MDTFDLLMAPETARARPYLSFSAISTYLACPLKYEFRYVLGLPEETVSASLAFGGAFHAGLEFTYRELQAGSQAPSLDTLLDVFWTSWRAREEQTIEFPRGEDVSSIGRLADRMFQAFLASDLARPQGVILGVEEELRGSLLPGLPPFLARVDLLVEAPADLTLTDFKTSRTAWSQDHVSEAAGQLLLYHELVQPLAQGRPVKLSFAVFTKTKTPQICVHPVKVDRHQIARTKRLVEAAWQGIVSEQFFPRPSPLQCPTCPFRTACQAWGGDSSAA